MGREPAGSTGHRLKTVLWLDEQAPQASFNTTVTKARSSLGLAADGTHHLPHLVDADGRYRLGPSVALDVDVIERRLAVVRKRPTDAAIETLVPAVELVRGMPFEGVRSGYEWAHADGLVARMEAVVADAAHVLAELALAKTVCVPSVVTEGEVVQDARSPSPRKENTHQGLLDTNKPRGVGTSSWPPAGTATWPLTKIDERYR
jgi:hypothetical protein